MDQVQLSQRASSIVASDSRVAIVGKQGNKTEVTLFNGDTLDELGQIQFDLNSNGSNDD